jgi:CHAT domain-containing protein
MSTSWSRRLQEMKRTRRDRTRFLITSCLVLLFIGCADPMKLHEGEVSVSGLLMQGALFHHQGAFEQAITAWNEADRVFRQESKPDMQSETLIRLSHAYLVVGHYERALTNAKAAFDLAKGSQDESRMAAALGAMGNAKLSLGDLESSFLNLSEGLAITQRINNPLLTASMMNNLGNLHFTQKRFERAKDDYHAATALSTKFENSPLFFTTLINEAKASLQLSQYREAKSLLDEARIRIMSAEASYAKAHALVSIGLAYDTLGSPLASDQGSLLKQAIEALNDALSVGNELQDHRVPAYALGYLGRIYERQGEYEQAYRMTQRALLASQRVNAPESLYRWDWQMGRILNAIGKTGDAVAAYRRAISTLQSIRQEATRCYGGRDISFREIAEPMCSELIDLLLKESARHKDSAERLPYLIEARELVELLKVYELRDYFHDECVDAARPKKMSLDELSGKAVVIHIILLKDRTEILAALPSGLKQYRVNASATSVTEEVRELRTKIEKRTTWEFLPHAQRLYEWLIRPLEADIESFPVHTLVFVPDGALRTIPMAALHDGKHFLVQKYPVAITPGLCLADPRPIQEVNLQVLAAGLTAGVQGFAPLPHVAEEIKAIYRFHRGTPLLDQDFLIPNLEKELRKRHFNVLHIASHGRFGGNPDNTFLLSFDDRVTMDRLSDCVGLSRFRDNPLELLVLSACETAAGDERAALGLAGVAVKAGARSALATLWHVNDPVSSRLVEEFYRELGKTAVTRAMALRRAQLRILGDARYEHPGYWAPFLLINNWL